MTRRSLSVCLGAAALLGSLGLPARSTAKPPDLPQNEIITVQPKTAPASEHGPNVIRGWLLPPKIEEESQPTDPAILNLILRPSTEPVPAHPLLADMEEETEAVEGNTGSLIFGVGVNSNSGLCGRVAVNECNCETKRPSIVEGAAKEQLPPPASIYESLPASVPTPTLYQLRPTARRTLVGAMLMGINPALALLPTEKALDAPHDHPRKVAGDDVLGDVPAPTVEESGFFFGNGGPFYITREGDWLKWLLSHWTVYHETPAPELNEGYVHAVCFGADIDHPPEDASDEDCEAPAALAAELLPMPREAPEAAKDSITCPYLRQQRMDRHACQLADPQMGHDVLDNLERLRQSDGLLELADKLLRDGCIIEAMDCCALAADLCPGSPTAERAADRMCDLCRAFSKPEMSTEEAAEEQPQASRKKVRGGCCRQVKIAAKRSTAERSIEQKLKQPVSLHFANVPLRTVLDDLRSTMGINLFVDEPALAEKGINPDAPISIELDQLAFKSALNLLLREVHLTYVVGEDVLQITTEDHAHGRLEHRVFAVGDLLHAKKKARHCPAGAPEDALIRMITTTILPRSWSERGGRGTIDFFPQTAALVVNQTPDVQDQIADLLAALRRSQDRQEEKEEKTAQSRTEPGVEQEVDGLMKACHLLMNEGLHERAAELARQAFALDPERVMADPLLYKMHLLASTPACQPFGSKHPAGASEECEEPPTCPYCPSGGKPIQDVLPQKKESKSGPTTLLVPPLPPVDYEVVPALDRVLTESVKNSVKLAGSEEASEGAESSGISELVEAMMDRVGVQADGLRLSGEWSCGGKVYHVRYANGCLAIWKTRDAGKVKP